MLVYLADLDHIRSMQSNKLTPLSAGFIGSYLKKVMPDITLKIFKDPRKIIDQLSTEPPDVLGLSQYTWNVRLNYAVTKKAKEIKKDMAIVMGGPYFDRESPDWIIKFFQERPQLDMYIVDEGEWSFTYLVKLIKKYGNNINDIPFDEWPSCFYAIDRKQNIIKNNQDRLPESISLKDIPSPYLTGLLDSFLDEGQLVPIIETSRGCPYTCAFCTWSSRFKTSEPRLLEFPLETVKSEIYYIKDRNCHPSGNLYLADTNFGILNRDLEISKIIKECADNYNFPKLTYIYFAKNITKRIVEIAQNLRKVYPRVSMSKQSLNPETLTLIKRKNISNEIYDELRKECEKNNIETYCELIYGLPGETYNSFIDGVISTIRSKQTVALYNLRLDTGEELSTTKSRQKYGMETAFRVQAGAVFSYNDVHLLEYEEFVTKNKWMSEDNILSIRLFQFILFILDLDAFKEFRKGLFLYGFDHGTLIQCIIEDKKNYTPLWKEIVGDFLESVISERIPSHKAKLEFTKEDIEVVRIDEIALNIFYMSKIVSELSYIEALKEYLMGVLYRFYSRELKSEEMQDLKDTLNISFDNIICYEEIKNFKSIESDFDIDGWLESRKVSPLRLFISKKPVKYKLEIDKEILYHLEKAKEEGMDTVHAVYYLRMHVLHLYGDRIFCYNRMQI